MTTPTIVGPEGLAEFADKCAKALFSGVKYRFKFPKACSLQHWPDSEIKAANERFLKTLRHRANVYALFVRDIDFNDTWRVTYVGESKSSELRSRITQHMICKDYRTGSMLDTVKIAVASSQEIGLSFIKVQPESLRLFTEEKIISTYKNSLPWNTHG